MNAPSENKPERLELDPVLGEISRATIKALRDGGQRIQTGFLLREDNGDVTSVFRTETAEIHVGLFRKHTQQGFMYIRKVMKVAAIDKGDLEVGKQHLLKPGQEKKILDALKQNGFDNLTHKRKEFLGNLYTFDFIQNKQKKIPEKTGKNRIEESPEGKAAWRKKILEEMFESDAPTVNGSVGGQPWMILKNGTNGYAFFMDPKLLYIDKNGHAVESKMTADGELLELNEKENEKMTQNLDQALAEYENTENEDTSFSMTVETQPEDPSLKPTKIIKEIRKRLKF